MGNSSGQMTQFLLIYSCKEKKERGEGYGLDETQDLDQSMCRTSLDTNMNKPIF